jgi:diaminohydroxyphosphoribosylaminopyrimidine deaminase/5-amino-6-(5-phosphoribosylamino)uracil reductase
VRIVVDSKARLLPSSKLAESARATPTWLICTQAAPNAARDLLLAKGVEIIEVEATPEGRVDIAAAARALGARGLTRVVVEGGGTIAAAFLKAGLVDRVSSYRAGLFLGGDSRSAVAALGIDGLDFAPRFTLVSSRAIGGDTLETWRKVP